jgi:hypothetical protein
MVPAPVNGSTPPPTELLGAEDAEPPAAVVVVDSPLLLVSPEVEVTPDVDVAPDEDVAPEDEVAPDVVVSFDVLVVEPDVVVVGLGTQPVTQNTLYLVSAPWEPSAWTVSLTWKPCTGWGVMPVKSRV